MKNRVKATVATAALAAGILALSAGSDSQAPDAHARATAGDTVIVAVEIGPNELDPGEITLAKDQPARIVFTRTVEATCAKKIHIPEFGIEATALPLNEPVANDLSGQSSEVVARL